MLEDLSDQFPVNLAIDIYNYKNNHKHTHINHFINTLNFELINEYINNIGIRNKEIILRRYKDKESYNTIGHDISVITSSRIQQIIKESIRDMSYIIKNDAQTINIPIIDYNILNNVNDSLRRKNNQLLNILDDNNIPIPKELKSIRLTSKAISDNIQIIDLKLTTRTENALIRHGIKNVNDLMKINYDNLIAIRNLGQKSIDELYTLLKSKYQIDIKKP